MPDIISLSRTALLFAQVKLLSGHRPTNRMRGKVGYTLGALCWLPWFYVEDFFLCGCAQKNSLPHITLQLSRQ